MDTVLTHLRDLINEYEARLSKFTVVMLAIQSGAPAGEVVAEVVRYAMESEGVVGNAEDVEPMSDDVAETMVFTMGSAANAALNDLRFLEALLTGEGVVE